MTTPTPEQCERLDYLLEYDEDGPIFMHSEDCQGFCDFGCAGLSFENKDTAFVIQVLLHQRDSARLARDHFRAERDRLAEAMKGNNIHDAPTLDRSKGTP